MIRSRRAARSLLLHERKSYLLLRITSKMDCYHILIVLSIVSLIAETRHTAFDSGSDTVPAMCTAFEGQLAPRPLFGMTSVRTNSIHLPAYSADPMPVIRGPMLRKYERMFQISRCCENYGESSCSHAPILAAPCCRIDFSWLVMTRAYNLRTITCAFPVLGIIVTYRCGIDTCVRSLERCLDLIYNRPSDIRT